MNFDWQIFLVLAVVAAAAAYLGRQAWRTWRASKTGCAGGCGCGTKAAPAAKSDGVTLIPADQLTLRRRTGGM
jgi:hypothetical protein